MASSRAHVELFSLLIIFWVADAGPLQYGKQLSEKLFKAAGTPIPAGILFAAVFSVGTTFLAESLTGSPAMAPGADGSFATPTGFVIDLTIPLAWVFGPCAIPVAHGLQLLTGTGLGEAASAATNKVKSGGSKAMCAATGGGGGGGGGGGSGIQSRLPVVGGSGGSGGQRRQSQRTSGTDSGGTVNNVADAPDQGVTARAFADGGTEQAPSSPGERTEYADREAAAGPSQNGLPAPGSARPSEAAAAETESESSKPSFMDSDYQMESVRDMRSSAGHGTDEELAPKQDLREMSSYEFYQKE